jgi:hypothetical protein
MRLQLNTLTAYLTAGSLILLAPIILGYLVSLQMFLYRLRHEHPRHYEELGRPSLFLNNSISNGFRVVRYLINRDYLAITDARASQLGDRTRRLFMVSLWVFGIFLVGFAVLGATY